MSELEKATQAVLDRWDSPVWEWTSQGPTAALMADLRKALAAHKEQQAEPVVDVQAAVLAEREACAKLCESTTASWTEHLYNAACADCAEAIRGQAKPVKQAEPVAIPGAIPMSEITARSRSMPERADALEAARKRGRASPVKLKYVISPTRMTWDEAMKWAEGLGMRLATVAEMREMGLPPDFYWSGTEYSQSCAWSFNAYNGNKGYGVKNGALFAVAVAKQADSGNPSY
jgi:hypothetical protein